MRIREKLESVHFLRFFASFVVVIHHSMQYFGSHIQNGASGVDIFFVISGVVIGLCIGQDYSPSKFALKRFIRVMPLYWIATLIYSGVRYFSWGAPSTVPELLRSFALWPSLGTTSHLIYWPAWTLEYEMLFYSAVFIFLLAFGQKARVLIAIAFCAISAARIPILGTTSYFESSLCVEFVAGIGIAIVIEHFLIPTRWVGISLVLAALALLCSNNYRGEATRTLYWGIPAAMLVFGALSFETDRWLKNPIIQIGGNASYSIYLVHLTAIEYFGYLAEHFHLLKHELSFINCAGLTFVAIICGLVMHFLVEKPLIGWLNAVAYPKKGRELPMPF